MSLGVLLYCDNVFYFMSFQIIYKINQNSTGMTPNEVCDKLFELVDENQDGKFSGGLLTFISILLIHNDITYY